MVNNEETCEHTVGKIWIDRIDGIQVMTVNDSMRTGCKECAYSTVTGAACPGVVYDRHPCCSSDRNDGQDVFFRLLAYVPEAKARPLRVATFGTTILNTN